ncbi:MAG: hypothetical protein L0Y70_15960, partial [Gemmataceae bacterium]|nr:hypothetical protein [Gemmataceae bacterium]
MRAIWALLILGLTSALTLPAIAQQPAGSIFTGVDPRAVKVTPIDLNKAMQPYNMSSSFRKAPTANPFNLSNFFRKMTLGTWPPLVAKTPILEQKNNA